MQRSPCLNVAFIETKEYKSVRGMTTVNDSERSETLVAGLKADWRAL